MRHKKVQAGDVGYGVIICAVLCVDLRVRVWGVGVGARVRMGGREWGLGGW